MNNLRAIDLFAGAGGFGLGFELAGYEVPFSLEIDEWASQTLKYNNPLKTVITSDIRDWQEACTINAAVGGPVDVVIGGPPCQGFSVAGPSKKDPSDPRNSLFLDFARWVSAIAPKAFVIENVRGLTRRRNTNGIPVISIIRQTMEELGFLVEVWVLNAAEFGIPQARERVFIVGHRLNEPIGAPERTHQVRMEPLVQPTLLEDYMRQPSPTVWDAISDLPELEAGAGEEEQPYSSGPDNDFQAWCRLDSGLLFNHVAMRHSQRLVRRFETIGWGESGADASGEHAANKRNGNGTKSESAYDQNNRRLYPGRPSHTITASFYANFLHPYQHRNLTAREGARLQTFPDSYRFCGKKTVVSQKLLQRENRRQEQFLCQYNQIGNAVPPLLASRIADHLKESGVL